MTDFLLWLREYGVDLFFWFIMFVLTVYPFAMGYALRERKKS